VFSEAVAAYRELRSFSGNPSANEGMLTRAEKARVQACVTEAEGRIVKASSLPNGLGKRRAMQKIVREFGDSNIDSSNILPQIWALACEFDPVPGGPSADSGAAAAAAST
jgi:hypothetical protein